MEPVHLPPAERRGQKRTEVLATAVVFTPQRLHGTYLVQDLSAGGACLIGAGSLDPGVCVTVMVQLPRRPMSSVSAKVIHRGPTRPAGTHYGIQFMNLEPDQEDTIQEAITSELEKMRARRNATVLLMYHEGETREGLEKKLHGLGRDAIGVATPLEAIGWLQRPDTRIDTALIELSFGPARGVDMLHFLSEHYPDIQRVVISDDEGSFRVNLALRSGRAHRVLHKPWNEVMLGQAMTREKATSARG